MIEHILWTISFFSLWLVLIWLQIIYLEEPNKKKNEDLPSVTIAIAAYNEEETISKTVDSITNSDYPKEKIEIIVVNDGSTDNTAEVLEPYMDRIVYIYKENGGQGSAVNAGIEAATGEYIGRVDDDDLFMPEKVEEIWMFVLSIYRSGCNIG